MRSAGRDLAYSHVHEPIDPSVPAPRIAPRVRERFEGPLVLNGGYDGRTAADAIAGGEADLVSFGRPFIADPDLPERLSRGALLQTPDPSTFYGGGAEGYTDYPTLDES